jgi:hypothetical protein
VLTFIIWLARGRQDRPQPVAELPGDTSRHKLTRWLIVFALIRAVVLAGAAALAFGLDLPHGSADPGGPSAAFQLRRGAYRVLWTLCGVGMSGWSCSLQNFSVAAPPGSLRGQPRIRPEPRREPGVPYLMKSAIATYWHAAAAQT